MTRLQLTRRHFEQLARLEAAHLHALEIQFEIPLEFVSEFGELEFVKLMAKHLANKDMRAKTMAEALAAREASRRFWLHA